MALMLAADGVLPKKRPAGKEKKKKKTMTRFFSPRQMPELGTASAVWEGGEREQRKATEAKRTEDFRWLARSSLRNTE